MKKNIEWYPHRKDSHRHPKFKMLRTLYGSGNVGWAMEGRFWALNNIIADSEECKIDLSKVRNKAVLAEELNLSLSELDQFIDHLLSSEVELLYETNDNIYTTKKVKEALELSLEEREKARLRKGKSKSSGGKDKSSGELPESSGEKLTHDSKVEYKKVHDNTVEESKDDSEDLPSTSLPDFNLPLITDYSEYKPQNFQDSNHVRNKIENILSSFLQIPFEKGTITRIFNIISKTNNGVLKVKTSDGFNFLYKMCIDFHSFEEKKRNYRYFCNTLEDKILDALNAGIKKEDNGKVIPSNGFSDINKLTNKMSID